MRPELLLEVLEEAREHGFLGPGPVQDHIHHARGFLAILNSLDRGRGVADAPMRAVDLGSGGGVPGLVLALEVAGSQWLLVDSNQRRTAFLRHAIEMLDVASRVAVCEARAEEAGRDSARRGAYDVVVARSFGPPAVTAECAAPFLRTGGSLVVSEPPGSDGARWSVEGLRRLGMEPLGVIEDVHSYQVIVQATLCGDEFPRRTGIPAKRPLF